MEREALGLIECRGLVAIIEAADPVKSANVTLVGCGLLGSAPFMPVSRFSSD